MADDQCRQLAFEPLQRFNELGFALVVESAVGIVEDKDLRFACERARNGNALYHAVGEIFFNRVAEHCVVAQRQQVNVLFKADQVSGHAGFLRARARSEESQVLQDRAGEHLGVVADVGDVPAQIPVVDTVQILSVYHDLAGGRFDITGNQASKRRSAAAVASLKGNRFSGIDRQAQILDRHDRIAARGEAGILQLDVADNCQVPVS